MNATIAKFEKLSHLYVARVMDPVWKEYADHETDAWASLRLFLKLYAFERQGRSPDYAFVAVDAVRNNRSARPNPKSAQVVWNAFKSLLRNKSLNYANNPLCPRGTHYRRLFKNVKHRTAVKDMSAVELAADQEVGRSLVAWAREHIKGSTVKNVDGQACIKKAHGQLCKINGISNKIASFFLRDVACRFRFAPKHDRELLQPIDVWIRFVVRELSRSNRLSDDGCARWITRNSRRPEAANQGIWYFCAKIAHSSNYLVRRALDEPAYFEQLVSKHLAGLRRAATAADAYERSL